MNKSDMVIAKICCMSIIFGACSVIDNYEIKVLLMIIAFMIAWSISND